MRKKRGSKTSASAANWLWESQSHSQTLCSDSFSSERFQEQIGFENGKNVAPAQKEQSGGIRGSEKSKRGGYLAAQW